MNRCVVCVYYVCVCRGRRISTCVGKQFCVHARVVLYNIQRICTPLITTYTYSVDVHYDNNIIIFCNAVHNIILYYSYRQARGEGDWYIIIYFFFFNQVFQDLIPFCHVFEIKLLLRLNINCASQLKSILNSL